MARNKVMKLWTAIVTAFLALCTALGIATSAAAAPVPQLQPERNSCADETVPAMSPSARSYALSLPPTMKQRIHAEAHGSSPSCRHRPPADADTTDNDAARHALAAPSQPETPLQR